MWEFRDLSRLEEDSVNRIQLLPIGMNKIGSGLPNPHDELDVNKYHHTSGQLVLTILGVFHGDRAGRPRSATPKGDPEVG